MKNLFDIKVMVVAVITAFGWGGNYFVTAQKVDEIKEQSETHVTRKEFALQQALSEYKIATNKENIEKLENGIDRIYERYGWTRD